MGIASVGMSNGELLVSVPSVAGGSGNILAAGSQTADATATVSFANSNGMSFGMSNSSVITASYTVPTQTNQSIGLYGLGNTSGTSTATVDARSLSVSAAGSISVDMSGGTLRLSVPNAITTAMASNRGSDFVQASANFNGTNASGTIASNNISVSVAAQSAQTVGLYGIGNTAGTSSGTADARSLSFDVAGSLTVNMSNDGKIHLSAPNAITTAMASNRGSDFVNATAAFAGTNATGTIASNGVSVSVAAQSVQTQGLVPSIGVSTVGNTAGNTGLSSGVPLVLQASNGAKWSQATDGTNVTAILQPYYYELGMSNLGNTSGTTGTVYADVLHARLMLAGGNNVTLSQSIGTGIAARQATITISAASQTNQSLGLYGLGNTSGTSTATVDARSHSFSAAGSLSIDVSGGTVRFSAPNAITTAMASNRGSDFVNATAAFAGTNATGTIASNGISVSVSNQSNQSIGLYGLGNTSGTSTATVDARSLSVSAAGSITADMSGGTLRLSVPNAITTAMASNRGSDFVNATAAFAGTNANGTIASNGISVSVPAQTNQTIGIYGSGNTSGTSTGTLDARSFTIQAQGSLTVDMTNGKINLSAPNALTTAMASNRGTDFVQANANFNGTNASGTIASNNISVSVAAQTNQSIGIYGSSQTTGQSSSSTYDARSLTFRGAGGISVGNSGGEIIISGGAGAQSNQTIGLYASGNTSGTSTGTVDARSLTINVAGSITADMTNGMINLSAPNAITTAMASNRGTDFVQANANFNGTNASGTIASNNISVSVAAQSAQTVGLYGSGNTAGTSSGTADARSLSFDVAGSLTVNMSNDGKIHFSAPNAITTAMASNRGSDFVAATAAFAGTNANGTIASNGISVSVPAQTNQSIGLYGLGNTSGTSTATVDARSLSVSAAGSITADMSGGTIRLSVPNAITTAMASDAGTRFVQASATIAGTNITGTIASNGMSLSGAAQSVQTQGLIPSAGVSNVGNTAGNTGTSSGVPLVLQASNGAKWSQATATDGFTAILQPFFAELGVSNLGNTSGTTGTVYPDVLNARFVLAGGNNVTLSQSVGTGIAARQATVTISAASQTNQSLGIYASSQTVGQSSSSTYDARSLTIVGSGGGVSVGWSNGSLILNASTALNAAQTNQSIGLYGSGNTSGTSSGTVDARSLTFNAQGGISVDMTNNKVNFSVPVDGVVIGGNTAGTTASLTSATWTLAGGSNVTLSQANGQAVSINAGGVLDFFEPLPVMQSGSTSFAPGISSWYVQPTYIPSQLLSGRFNVIHMLGGTSQNILQASTGTIFATNTTGGASQSYVLSRWFGVYSRGAGTNNTRLESVSTFLFPVSISHSVGVSLSNATQVTASRQVDVRYPSQIDISGNSTIATIQATHATSSAGSSVGTSFYTSALASVYNILTGSVLMPFNMNTSLSAGNYWIVHGWISAHTTAGSTLPSPLPALTQAGHYGASSYSARQFGQTASSTGSQYMPGLGVFSVQSASQPATIAFTDVRSYASNVIPYWNFMRSSVS
jgi:hypothetical protein